MDPTILMVIIIVIFFIIWFIYIHIHRYGYSNFEKPKKNKHVRFNNKLLIHYI
jgi:hypothetical protein